MKTTAIFQARMSSSRLPGKVLLAIDGKPMLQHVIERTLRARSLDTVLLATTTDPSDDPLADFAASMEIDCFRGSLHDVLDRYYRAAQTARADLIVRITADCPLIDPAVIDQTVELLKNPSAFNSPKVDFSCNRLPPPFSRTFPIGLDVEACTFSALERAWNQATETFHREHVMPFLYEGLKFEPKTETEPDPRPIASTAFFGTSPRGFGIAQLQHQPDYGKLRWTVDTPEDLTFIREIFARLGDKKDFSWYDVLEIVQKEPELAKINAEIRHKTMTEVDNRSKIADQNPR
jgi:spore coat polysaccharide biosynthesis protein SpsF